MSSVTEAEQKLSIIYPRLSESFFQRGFTHTDWLLIILPVNPGCSLVLTHALSIVEEPSFISSPMGKSIPQTQFSCGSKEWLSSGAATTPPPWDARARKGPHCGSARLFPVTAPVGNALKGFWRTWGVQRMFQSRCFTFSEHKLCNL